MRCDAMRESVEKRTLRPQSRIESTTRPSRAFRFLRERAEETKRAKELKQQTSVRPSRCRVARLTFDEPEMTLALTARPSLLVSMRSRSRASASASPVESDALARNEEKKNDNRAFGSRPVDRDASSPGDARGRGRGRRPKRRRSTGADVSDRRFDFIWFTWVFYGLNTVGTGTYVPVHV